MITEGTPQWRPGTNLHEVWCTKLPLGITCTCGRRAVVPLARLGRLQGNTQPLHTLKLRCTVCGETEWRATLFVTMHEVEAFADRPLLDRDFLP